MSRSSDLTSASSSSVSNSYSDSNKATSSNATGSASGAGIFTSDSSTQQQQPPTAPTGATVQQQQQQQQQPFGLQNAFAQSHQQVAGAAKAQTANAALPPGYAYCYGQMPPQTAGLANAFGGAAGYPATMAAMPGGAGISANAQYQPTNYGSK